jgi:hypothetical protein
MFGNEQSVWETLVMPTVCQNFVCAQYAGAMGPDPFIKERLSFVEIAFRDREAVIAKLNAELPARLAQADRDAFRPPSRNAVRVPGNSGDGLRAWNRQQNEAFQNAAAELNERFRRAGARLHYHNGFIQMSDDEQIQRQVEAPFWALVKDVKWANVDTDIKEAIDRLMQADATQRSMRQRRWRAPSRSSPTKRGGRMAASAGRTATSIILLERRTVPSSLVGSRRHSRGSSPT